MTSIKLIVNGSKARAEVDGVLASGSVGIPVTIEYDSTWDGLTKHLVCTNGKWEPTGKPRTMLNIDTAATVAHEVMIADHHLYLGVEGRSSDGSLLVPTVWADCGPIFPGADANADPSAQPTLPIWAQLQKDIQQLKQDDLTQNQLAALDGMFRICAFTADPSAAYTAFLTAFGLSDSEDTDVDTGGDDSDTGGDTGGDETVTTYSVTNDLTNVTTDNAATEVAEGGTYTANLTVAEGNVLSSLVITMGGVDVTADVYGDGYILITEVTGDVVITAIAGKTVLYQLADTPKSVSGLSEDTGISFGSDNANGYTTAMTICIAYTGFGANETLMQMSAGAAFGIATNGAGGNANIRVTCCSNAVEAYPTISENSDYRCVITKDARVDKTVGIHYLSGGAVTSISNEGTYGKFNNSACAGNLLVGSSDITVNNLTVYAGILSDADIEAFLNGGDI